MAETSLADPEEDTPDRTDEEAVRLSAMASADEEDADHTGVGDAEEEEEDLE